MQYLVRMDFVDPGPLLPIQQYVGMMRQAVLTTAAPALAQDRNDWWEDRATE